MGARHTRADAFERALAYAREVVAGEAKGNILVLNAAWRIRSELASFGWKGPRFQQIVLSEQQFDAVGAFLRCWRVSGPDTTAEISHACGSLLADE